jgi:uncharacterized protein (DUF2062 family)
MNDNEDKFRRIRAVKRILRYLPRRASIGRYPVLNRFADAARKRSYLWSFRVSEVVPAFYLGWIITLMPIISAVQIVIAFFVAILCRANVVILAGLQLLSNPFTFIFLWTITYKVGSLVVGVLGIPAKAVDGEVVISSISHYGGTAIRGLFTIVLGALVLGPVLGLISSEVYECIAKRRSATRNNDNNSTGNQG